MIFFDVGFGFQVAVDDVSAMLPYEVDSVYRTYKSYRDSGKFMSMCRGRKARTLIITKSGMAYTSAYKAHDLVRNIQELKLLKGDPNNE